MHSFLCSMRWCVTKLIKKTDFFLSFPPLSFTLLFLFCVLITYDVYFYYFLLLYFIKYLSANFQFEQKSHNYGNIYLAHESKQCLQVITYIMNNFQSLFI